MKPIPMNTRKKLDSSIDEFTAALGGFVKSWFDHMEAPLVTEAPAPKPAPVIKTEERKLVPYGPAHAAVALQEHNIDHDTQVAFRFRAPKSGLVRRMNVYWKYDFKPGRTGYHRGTGGTIRVTLRQGSPDGKAVGKSTDVTFDIRPETGTDDYFRQILFAPTMPLVAGKLYYLTFENIDRNARENFLSLNSTKAFNGRQHYVEPVRGGEFAVLRRENGTWKDQPGHSPIFVVTMGDGTAFGNPFFEVYDERMETAIGGQTLYRERFTATKNMRLKSLSVCAGRVHGERPLDVRLQSDVMTHSIELIYPKLARNREEHAWKSVPLKRTIRKGETYLLEFSAPAGTLYRMNGLRDGSKSNKGFPPNCGFPEGYFQVSHDGGNSWKGPRFWNEDDRRDSSLEWYFMGYEL